MRISRRTKRVGAVGSIAVAALLLLAGCPKSSPAESQHDQNLATMTNDLENPLTKTHPLPADGITVSTSYTTDYQTTDWKITSQKTLNIQLKVQVPDAAAGTQVMVEHMHADVSLIADNGTLNGWSQDSMDSSIHGGTQAGFSVDPTHGYNVVFSIEGTSPTLFNGWGYAVGGYGYSEIKEQRLTEDNLRKEGGVKGNKVSVVWVVLVKGPKDASFHEVSFADEFQVPVG